MEIQVQPTGFRKFSGVGKSFSRWPGRDGASYVFSIYEPDAIPAYRHAVYVVVNNQDGKCRPLLVGATTNLPALFFHGTLYNAALKHGGTEVHVHVPAEGLCPIAIADNLRAVLAVAGARSAENDPEFVSGLAT